MLRQLPRRKGVRHFASPAGSVRNPVPSLPHFRLGAALARDGALKGVDVIGWVSSIILVLTLGKQVRKQWQTRDSGGVSTWLFVGQLAASVGFSTYSFLLENWVFLTTNLLLVVNALLGQWVTLRNRRSTDHSGALPGV
jgi:MtN3 and saliva related transmembrane protein